MAALYNIYVYNNDGTQLLHTFDCDEPETAMHVYPDRLMLATSHIAYYPDGTIIGITTTQGSSTPTIEASDDSSTNYFYTDSDATVYLILEESALDDYSLSSLFIKQNGVLVPVQLVRKMNNSSDSGSGAVTDLTGTKWVFNETIDATSCPTAYINFETNGGTYYGIGFLFGGPSLRAGGGNTPSPSEPTITGLNYTLEGQDPSSTISVLAYRYRETDASWYWSDDAYRTIEILGGTDATNNNLIS